MADPKKINNKLFGASSVYENDFVRYGPHNARLNGSGGFRAGAGILSWILIILPKEMVITAISTQGYNDSVISEWVTQYHISYKGRDMKAIGISKVSEK